jgi:DNA-binding phage protein
MSNYKTTDLEKMLSEAKTLQKLLQGDLVKFVDKESFIKLLEEIMIDNNEKKSNIINKTGLSKSIVYKVFSGEKHPSKDTVLQIGISISCILEQMQELLKLSGNGQLYAKNRRDSIIIHGILNKKSVHDINYLLIDNNEKELFD